MRWLRYFLITLLAIASLAGVAVLVLFTIDLSGFQDDFEAIVSERTGRNFQIGGTFEPSLGEDIELVVSEVTLENAAWGVADHAISVERLHVSVSLWSLFSGPIIVRQLDVDGLVINVEKEPGTGQSNLKLAAIDAEATDISTDTNLRPAVLFENAHVADSEIRYGQGWLASPIQLAIREASITGVPGELLDVQLDATIDNDVPVTANGAVGPLESLIAAKNVRWDLGLTVGQFEAMTAGHIVDLVALEGADFDFTVAGPDARRLLERVGMPVFAEGTIDLQAEIAEADDGVHATIAGSFGDLETQLNLQADSLTGLQDGVFDLKIAGPNVQVVSVFASVGDLPAVPFSLETSATAAGGVISIPEFVAEMGGNQLNASGHVERAEAFQSARFTIDLTGPNAAEAFAPWLKTHVPAEPFSISGDIGYHGNALAFKDLRVNVERFTAALDGTTGRLPTLDGFDIDARMTSSDTRVLRDWLRDLVPDFSIPATAIEIATRLRRDGDSWRVQDTAIQSGEHRFTIDGALGDFKGLPGVDIVLSAEGPDLRDYYTGSVWSEPMPYRVQGRVSATDNLVSFAEFATEIGGATATIDGSLPISMQLDDVDATIEFDIPDLDIVSPFVAIDGLQGGPLQFSGRLSRRGNLYVGEDLQASLGDSDIRGDLSVELATQPKIVGQLQAQSLDLAPFLPRESAAAAAKDAGDADGRLLPDTELPLELMGVADIDLQLAIGDLRTRRYDVGGVNLRLNMNADSLQVRTGQVTLANGGDVSVEVDAQRTAGGADLWVSVTGKDFNLRKPQDDEGRSVQRSPIDIDLEVRGQGDSVHELAATANGFVRVQLGAGQLDRQYGAFLMRDVFAQVLGAINPLSKDSRYSTLECGIADLDIVDGVMTTNVLAARTPEVSVASVGTVDLATEAIDFSFRTRQREGIGVSVAGAINPFFRLAGTLGEPTIEIDAQRGFLSGAIAALTGGVSILAQGVFDRYLTEDNLCEAVAAGLDSGELKRSSE